jgi:uncharacterized protein YjbJ (UPF0337 family)
VSVERAEVVRGDEEQALGAGRLQMRRDSRVVVCVELKGRGRRHWWRLTSEEADRIEGDREILIGRLQERFGRTREQAAREVDEWFKGDVGRP